MNYKSNCRHVVECIHFAFVQYTRRKCRIIMWFWMRKHVMCLDRTTFLMDFKRNIPSKSLQHTQPIFPFFLTNKHSHKKPGQPLLFHLLDHWLFSRRCGFAHDSEGVDMSDGAHSRRGEPRQAEKWTDGSQNDNEQQIQVEAWAFHQATLLLTDNQSEKLREERKMLKSWKFSEVCVNL